MLTMTNDTVNLLRECNAGIKMGILSIDEMLGSIRSEALRERVKKSREVHCKLGAEAAKLLEELEHETKEPPPCSPATGTPAKSPAPWPRACPG